MKVRYTDVNDIVVSDEHLKILIVRKAKRRYRTIIRAYYNRIGIK